MHHARLLVFLAAMLALAGCQTPPWGPAGVASMWPEHKDFEAFRADDVVCRHAGAQSAGQGTAVIDANPTEPETPDAAPAVAAAWRGETPAQQRYDAAYAQCMASNGDPVRAASPNWKVSSPNASPYYPTGGSLMVGGLYPPLVWFSIRRPSP